MNSICSVCLKLMEISSSDPRERDKVYLICYAFNEIMGELDGNGAQQFKEETKICDKYLYRY